MLTPEHVKKFVDELVKIDRSKYYPQIWIGGKYFCDFSFPNQAEDYAKQIKLEFTKVLLDPRGKHPAMLALENLTVGGSEFCNDVDRCVKNIRDREVLRIRIERIKAQKGIDDGKV